MKTINKTTGFTLIELVIVVAILGVLAVTATPRFVDISEDAKASATEAQFGSFKSGLSLLHAKYLIRQTSPIQIGNTDVKFSNAGWPLGNTDDSTGCREVWNVMYSEPEPITVVADYNSTLAEGWNAFAYSGICGFIKSGGGETIVSSGAPHFVYFMRDFAVNAGGFNYSGEAGQVKIYNRM
ncbi:type II secretion system protein [Alteromonas pelagimontana]|uniref:Type II secretion system protein n=1 Tax=Alteromonas pelagimontana TaxID=1858656 RepID=A0A6M4MHG2_9ALTE|nr:type II secretion system protein [Alteromonas pelagimontana]QJR82641.1 type II secretion system protein [Alteromonas pelagimontana]